MAELLAGLSLVTDLAARHASEQALRASILAARLCERLGLARADAKHAFYATLLRFVGCTAPMPEYAESDGSAADPNGCGQTVGISLRVPADLLERDHRGTGMSDGPLRLVDPDIHFSNRSGWSPDPLVLS